MFTQLKWTKPFKVEYKRLTDKAVCPSSGSTEAAGWDLYSTAAYDIAPHSTVPVGTGLAIALPKGTFGAIFARSGLALKKGLRPANCVGVVDSDYRGEIIVALHNDTDEMMSIEEHTRIAQLVVVPYMDIRPCEVYSLDDTERGANGFGSTGER